MTAKEIISDLSLEEKCAQCLMISLGGSREVPAWLRDSYRSVPVGGLLFLGGNIPDTSDGVIQVTAELQDLASRSRAGIPLFLAVDHEGGSVFRLGGRMTRLPPAETVARGSGEEALRLYRSSSAQLAALGFNLNFAPVLEPRAADNQAFLGSRAYSADPARTALFAGLFAEAMKVAGVVAVGKHFPGSGDGDPHKGLPRLAESGPEGTENRLRPFREAIAKGLLPGIMVSHVLVERLDPDIPATLSPRVPGDLLRGELGFRGFVVSDDLNMKALSARYPAERSAVLALKAGIDLLMYLPGDYPAVHAALVRAVRSGELEATRLDDAAARIVEAKLEAGLWISSRKAVAERKTDFAELRKRGDVILESFLREAAGKRP